MFESEVYIKYQGKTLKVDFNYLDGEFKDKRKNIELKEVVDIDKNKRFSPKNRRVKSSIKELVIKKLNLV